MKALKTFVVPLGVEIKTAAGHKLGRGNRALEGVEIVEISGPRLENWPADEFISGVGKKGRKKPLDDAKAEEA